MKLIYAGQLSTASLDHTRFLFNCLRNASCQRPYFIPIRSFFDLQFYVDLPGKPSSYEVTLFNLCAQDCGEDGGGGGDFSDDFNDDFDNGGGGGGDCIPVEYPILWDKYVIGQQPNNNWYGVFALINQYIPINSIMTPITEVDIPCFYFRFVFTINGFQYVYFTEQFCIEKCEPLTLLKGCYPNEVAPAEALDCNGIYYGYPTKADYLGFPDIRYFHWAFVRKGSVIDSVSKLSFKYFNSRRNYKTTYNRERLLEFELVPPFYKDVIIGIFARGNIRVDEREFTLGAEVSYRVLDNDSKLWQLDTPLAEECFSSFGCAPADCLPRDSACANPPTDLSIIPIGVPIVTDLAFVFVGGTFAPGDQIEWEINLKSTGLLVTSGSVTAEPLSFQVPTTLVNLSRECYKVSWRKKCAFGTFTDWTVKEIGLCGDTSGGKIRATVDGILTGQTPQGGPVKLVMDFQTPTPGDIIINAGFDFKKTSGSYLDTSFGYPAPRTYSNYSPSGITDQGPVLIPAGTTHFEYLGHLTNPGAPYGYIPKVVLFSLTLPAGYALSLTPARSNLIVEVR